MDEQIRVFLIDDHAIVREGLSALLGREPDIEVVGQASSAEEALALMKESGAAVVVVDHRLPGMSGVELSREIAERRIQIEIVMLSAFLDRQVAEGALRAGVRAYVVKDVEADELKRAIRSAARGETTIDPKVPSYDERPGADGQMSPRHRKILAALAQGLSGPAIGVHLGLSRSTVKTYMRAIYKDLGVNSRAEAISVAARKGLI